MDILVNLFVSDQAAVPCRRQWEVVFFQRGFHPSIFFWCHREMKNMLVDYMNYIGIFLYLVGVHQLPLVPCHGRWSSTQEGSINFLRRYDPQALQRNSAPAGGDFPAVSVEMVRCRNETNRWCVDEWIKPNKILMYRMYLCMVVLFKGMYLILLGNIPLFPSYMKWCDDMQASSDWPWCGSYNDYGLSSCMCGNLDGEIWQCLTSRYTPQSICTYQN